MVDIPLPNTVGIAFSVRVNAEHPSSFKVTDSLLTNSRAARLAAIPKDERILERLLGSIKFCTGL